MSRTKSQERIYTKPIENSRLVASSSTQHLRSTEWLMQNMIIKPDRRGEELLSRSGSRQRIASTSNRKAGYDKNIHL